MKISDQGLRLIKGHEGLRLESYLCPAGVPTIGYGHTRGVEMGLTCTEAQADAWLLEDLQPAERGVRELVRVPLTQGQYDALVSFVFNLGVGAFTGSRLLGLLNARDYVGAGGEFPRWVHAGKKVLPGLVTRRAAERDMFLGQTRP